MSALLGSEEVPRAADLEVAHREVEARTQLLQFLDGADPRARIGVERAVARDQKVTIRLVRAAPDPPAELVEIGEPEPLGVVDQDRVRPLDVEAALHDRRRNQHIEIAAHERGHRLLERVVAHLAVGGRIARLGDERRQVARARLEGGDPIVDEIHLAAAVHLVADRLPQELVVLAFGYVGFDRLAPGGGVVSELMSRNPTNAWWSVRGIGVADIESTSTVARSRFKRSFARTPNRCSSSMITSPRSRAHVVR